jgi:hypothetical protein
VQIPTPDKGRLAASLSPTPLMPLHHQCKAWTCCPSHLVSMAGGVFSSPRRSGHRGHGIVPSKTQAPQSGACGTCVRPRAWREIRGVRTAAGRVCGTGAKVIARPALAASRSAPPISLPVPRRPVRGRPNGERVSNGVDSAIMYPNSFAGALFNRTAFPFPGAPSTSDPPRGG